MKIRAAGELQIRFSLWKMERFIYFKVFEDSLCDVISSLEKS